MDFLENTGEFLIDDRHDRNGTDKFKGELRHFGPGNKYPDWNHIMSYLSAKA